jgi:hypothetical protein
MNPRDSTNYPLPDNLSPPLERCVQVTIPDDPQYYQQLWSLINVATYWFAWDRDNAHSGSTVANTWKKIIATLQFCQPDQINGFGGGADTDMAIRQNPDNPCEIQSSQDGVTWCTFIDLTKCMNFGTQPGTGTTPPGPNGGTQQTCAKLNGNSLMLLPTAVNTGDTILLESAQGATNDPDVADFWIWRTPDGGQFFAGRDIGMPELVSTDPVPASPHLTIVVGIGTTSPSYYPISVGTLFTVPSGVSNQQVWLQVNDSNLVDNSGSIDVCVTVTNNQGAAWTSTLDFSLSPFGWTAELDAGNSLATYMASVGWQSVVDPVQGDSLTSIIANWPSAFTPDTMSVVFDASIVGGGVNGLVCNGVSSNPSMAGGTNITQTLTVGVSGSNSQALIYGSEHPNVGGTSTIKKVIFTGRGIKPSFLP